MKMTAIQPESWKEDYRQFEQATEQFYSGEMDAKTYKGISGGFGSYAQKGGKASMLRLRMPGGVMTKEKLAFVVQSIKEYEVKRVLFNNLSDTGSFTICQRIRFVSWL